MAKKYARKEKNMDEEKIIENTDVPEVIEDVKDDEIDDKKDLDRIYDKIDELAATIADRFDSLASVLIDSGAAVMGDVDELYDAADALEDSLDGDLEDLDYSL